MLLPSQTLIHSSQFEIVFFKFLHYCHVIIVDRDEAVDRNKYMDWMDKYQAQIVILSAQISWSESVEKALQMVADGKAKGTSSMESK